MARKDRERAQVQESNLGGTARLPVGDRVLSDAKLAGELFLGKTQLEPRLADAFPPVAPHASEVTAKSLRSQGLIHRKFSVHLPELS